MADLKLKVLVLPFLEEMAKHANWCRKHVSDVANCTCPAEGAQAEIDAIHAAVAATESKLHQETLRADGEYGRAEAYKLRTHDLDAMRLQLLARLDIRQDEDGSKHDEIDRLQFALSEQSSRLDECRESCARAVAARDFSEQVLHALQEKFGAQSRELVDALERLDGIKALRVEIVDLIGDHDETLQRLLWPKDVETPAPKTHPCPYCGGDDSSKCPCDGIF